jgi:hypothetical protein
MDYWLDLHMHSSISNDGEFSPSRLMEKCAAANLKTIALTDHDSVRGVKAARETAQDLQMNLISAIELSCQYQGNNLHLLGYGIDEDKSIFAEIEVAVSQKYKEIAVKRIESIRQLGFFLDEKKLTLRATKGIVASVMLAEVVLADPRNQDNPLLLPYRSGGKASDNPYVNFTWDFCVQGKPAYVPIHFMDLETAITIIHEAGGVAVLAHPGANIGCNESLAEDIIYQGIDGIEVYSNYHDATTRAFYQKKCYENHLLITVGSDFHGKVKPAVHLGEIGPENAIELLQSLIAAIKKIGLNKCCSA